MPNVVALIFAKVANDPQSKAVSVGPKFPQIFRAGRKTLPVSHTFLLFWFYYTLRLFQCTGTGTHCCKEEYRIVHKHFSADLWREIWMQCYNYMIRKGKSCPFPVRTVRSSSTLSTSSVPKIICNSIRVWLVPYVHTAPHQVLTVVIVWDMVAYVHEWLPERTWKPRNRTSTTTVGNVTHECTYTEYPWLLHMALLHFFFWHTRYIPTMLNGNWTVHKYCIAEESYTEPVVFLFIVLLFRCSTTPFNITDSAFKQRTLYIYPLLICI